MPGPLIASGTAIGAVTGIEAGSEFGAGVGLGVEFLRAAAWPGLLAGLLVLVLGTAGRVRRRRQRSRLVVPARMQGFLPAYSPLKSRARVVLAAVGSLLLALAYLGPVRGSTLRPMRAEGLDLVIAIDTSRSMLAEDVRPNRLERAVREVTGLLDQLRGDRVAILAFSGDAREVAPLTHDRSTLAALLRHLDPGDNRLGGTDLAAALRRALEVFDGRTGAHEAIVLITDGEDLEGHGAEVAAQAAERGIHVYVVGVGTTAGGKIPLAALGDPRFVQGRGSAFLQGPEGQEVVTRLDGTSLAHLAESTGGEYLSTEMSPTPLEDLYARRISRLARSEREGGFVRVPHDRYQWVLGLALGCMLLEAGLRERRGGPLSGGGA